MLLFWYQTIIFTGRGRHPLPLCTDPASPIQNLAPTPDLQTGFPWQTETWRKHLTSELWSKMKTESGDLRPLSCHPCGAPEVPETSALLQSLSKHIVFADVVVADGATSDAHGLFKVVLPDLWDWVEVLVL